MKSLPSDSSASCDVLIIGDCCVAAALTRRLKNSGARVLAVLDRQGHDAYRDDDVVCGELIQCDGFTGAFLVSVWDGQRAWCIQAAAIVIALGERRVPEYDFYGLTPGERVHALTQVEGLLEQGQFGQPDETVVLLNGLSHENHPTITGRMLNLCARLQMQSTRCNTVLITDNLKVAGRGLEALTVDVRRLGTFIYKLDGHRPVLHTAGEGRICLAFYDPIVRQHVELTADRVIVDERIVPAERMARIVATLRLRMDRSGFGQEDNVRRLTHLTNRRGIFVAGATRAVQSDEARQSEDDTLCAAVMSFLAGADRSNIPEVHIDTGRCGLCLTCHRTCPYAAVKIGGHMEVVPEACQACGLCVAACPAKAIRMHGGEPTGTLRFVPGATTLSPRIVAFCCQRSAGEALTAALALMPRLPEGLIRIQVPCGGRVGTNDIAAAFEADADGVLVLTCHDDNCHSQTGSDSARKRVEAVRNTLAAVGIEPERVRFSGIAANMGAEIARICCEFDNCLRGLASQPGAQLTKRNNAI